MAPSVNEGRIMRKTAEDTPVHSRPLELALASFLIACSAAQFPVFAQVGGAVQEKVPVFRVESSLVLVPFHVVRDKQFVRTLTAADVILLEDGEPREISLFEGGQTFERTVSLEIVLLFNVGTYTGDRHLLDPLVFRTSLLDELPYARLSVYGFDNLLMPFCPPTRDAAELKKAIEQVVKFSKEAAPPGRRGRSRGHVSKPPAGSIALDPSVQDPNERKQGADCLYRAIIVAAQTAALWPGNATRVILVVSSPMASPNIATRGPMNVTKPEDAAAAVARELGISLYPVLVDDERWLRILEEINPLGAVRHEKARDAFLGLGEATGGLAFAPKSVKLDVMRQIFAGVAEHVRSGYVAGFKPVPSEGQPKQHRVEVRLRSEDLGVVLGGARVVVH